jgi:hypothetical protein
MSRHRGGGLIPPTIDILFLDRRSRDGRVRARFMAQERASLLFFLRFYGI